MVTAVTARMTAGTNARRHHFSQYFLLLSPLVTAVTAQSVMEGIATSVQGEHIATHSWAKYRQYAVTAVTAVTRPPFRAKQIDPVASSRAARLQMVCSPSSILSHFLSGPSTALPVGAGDADRESSSAATNLKME